MIYDALWTIFTLVKVLKINKKRRLYLGGMSEKLEVKSEKPYGDVYNFSLTTFHL